MLKCSQIIFEGLHFPVSWLLQAAQNIPKHIAVIRNHLHLTVTSCFKDCLRAPAVSPKMLHTSPVPRIADLIYYDKICITSEVTRFIVEACWNMMNHVVLFCSKLKHAWSTWHTRSHQAPHSAITKNFPLSEVARHCIPEDCCLAERTDVPLKVEEIGQKTSKNHGNPVLDC